jgi:uncharacterized MAPEG superfamily protein
MSTDLTYLALTALLSGSLWIAYVVCQVMTNGFLEPRNYTDPTPRPLPLWGDRANRALMNSVETFAPFAAMVLIAHIANKSGSTTAFWAASFFWLRLVHAIVYIAGVPYIRTLIFTLGYVCLLGMFWVVMS